MDYILTIITTIGIALYIKCYIATFLGFTAHMAKTFDETRKLHKVGNGNMTLGQFITDNLPSHIINLCCAILWLLILPDAVKELKQINGSEFLASMAHIFICFVIAYFNSSVVLYFANKAKDKAMKIIDEKTNIADGK